MNDDVLIILSKEELEIIKKALLRSTVERLGFTDSRGIEQYIKVTAKVIEVIEKCEEERNKQLLNDNQTK